MFKKFLSSVGIGSAKVDTVLFNNQVVIGENVQGEVRIQGGNVEQEVNQIYLTIETTYNKESGDNHYLVTETLGKYIVSERFSLHANQQLTIPFSIQVPYHTPITFGKQKVYIRTGLDISMAIDPKDVDYITVLPNSTMDEILGELGQLGFKHTHESGICKSSSYPRNCRYVQEFELKPLSGSFRSHLDEIEIFFVHNDQYGLETIIEVDRKAKGFKGLIAEQYGFDEKHIRLKVNHNQYNYGQIEQIIRQNMKY